MRAILFEDTDKLRFGDYPDPEIQDPKDIILKVSDTAICGSDIHVIEGRIPGMQAGCPIGHEYAGEIIAAGSDVHRFKVGDRVVGAFPIMCGQCWYCQRGDGTNCEDHRVIGMGLLMGDLPGAQAEFVRVPNADWNVHAIDPALSNEQALFAGDIMSTGAYIAEKARIQPGDSVAIVGAGPVGLFTTMFALLYEPSKVFVVDLAADRLKIAESLGAIPVDSAKVNAVTTVQAATGDRGADVVIECVGGSPTFFLAMNLARPGGTVAVIGVNSELEIPFPMAEASWLKNLTIVFGGQANVQGVWTRVLDAVRDGRVDPTVIISHRLPLEDGLKGYEMFRRREALKVVLTP